MNAVNVELQAQLAVEHMSAKHCKECKFYCYGKEDQVCLHHSTPIEECNVVRLYFAGELNNAPNNKISN